MCAQIFSGRLQSEPPAQANRQWAVTVRPGSRLSHSRAHIQRHALSKGEGDRARDRHARGEIPSPRPSRLSPLSDGPHDDAAGERNRVAADAEAVAVAVGPGGPNRGSDGGVAIAVHAVQAVRRATSGERLLLRHLKASSKPRTAASWGAHWSGTGAGGQTRANGAPEGSELHGAHREVRGGSDAGLTGGGPAPRPPV